MPSSATKAASTVKAVPPQISQFIRLELLLKQITYKPGTKFRMAPMLSMSDGRPSDHVMVYVTVKAWSFGSTEKEGSFIDILTPFSLNSGHLEAMTDEEVFRYVFDKVVELERHEATEWFKVNGANLIEPHPELKVQR